MATTRLSLTLCSTLVIVLASASYLAFADNKDPVEESSMFLSLFKSTHGGSHSNASGGKTFGGCMLDPAPAEDVKLAMPNGWAAILKHRMKLKVTTPFVKLSASAEKGTKDGVTGYKNLVQAEENWDHSTLTTGEAKFEIKYHGTGILWAPACHTEQVSVAAVSVSTTPPPLVAQLRSGGEVALTETAPGHYAFLFDEAGDVVWEVPPEIAIVLTSVVDPQTLAFTYLLENVSTEARTFAAPEITSPAFPNGWSGTILGNSSLQIQVHGSSGEAVFLQNCTLDTTKINDSDYEQGTTTKVYVPQSRVAYLGTHSIVGAACEPAFDRNAVSFTVNSPAEIACLYRLDASGTHLVAELESEFLPDTTYVLHDVDPPAGTNTYYVATGSGCNYYCTPEESQATITN